MPTASLNDQFVRSLVISVLLGTIISLLSQSRIVVARIRIRVTVPLTPPTVTVSPIRTGRSNNRIKPETKLAKISCSPKPRPTPTAATSHCTFDHPTPIVLNTTTIPSDVRP